MVNTAVIITNYDTHCSISTDNLPIDFVHINGIPIIVQSIEKLVSCGIERIILYTCHNKDKYEALCEHYPEVICCFNQEHKETDILDKIRICYSLIGNNDFLLLESNIIFEPKAITSLLESKDDSVTLQCNGNNVGISKLRNCLIDNKLSTYSDVIQSIKVINENNLIWYRITDERS